MKYVFLIIAVMAVTYLTLPNLELNTADASFTHETVGELKDIAAYKKELKSFSSKKSLPYIDSLTVSFIETTEITKTQKFDLILELLAQEKDDYAFKYLADILVFLNPYDVSKEIIALISKTESSSKKIGLIDVLGSSIYPVTDDNQTTKDYLYSIMSNFSDSADDGMFHAAFNSYVALASPQEVSKAVATFF